MLPHLGVHGRANYDRRGGGQGRGGEHVVCTADGEFSDQVCTSWGDKQQLSPLSDGNMLHRPGVGK